MVRNKYIILSFLGLAWTIIFLHSVIPHNHHSDDLFSEFHYCYLHQVSVLGEVEINSGDHNCHGHVCHFHVDLLTQFSIDNVFIANTSNTFFNYLTFVETFNDNHCAEFVNNQIVDANYLRGPPPKEYKS